MKFLIFSFLAVVFFSSLGQAGVNDLWTPEDQAVARSTKYRFNDGYASTLYGSVMSGRQLVMKGFDVGAAVNLKAPMENFRTGFGKFWVYLPLGKSIELAPVMVFVPPGTSGGDNHLALRGIEFFRQLGYVTIVFPSPSSVEFASNLPRDLFSKDDFATFMSRSIAIAKIQFRLKGKVHLYAESMGSFFSSYFYVQDSKQDSPLITGTATFSSPPLELNTWLENVDSGTLRECDQPTYSPPYFFDGMWKVGMWAMGFDMKGNSSSRELRCLVLRSFQVVALKTTRRIHEMFGYGSQKVPNLPEPEISKWWFEHSNYKEMTEILVVDQSENPYNQAVSEDFQMETWLGDLVQEKGNTLPLRIVMAEDDVLATRSVIEKYRNLLGPEHMLVLNTGGHLGYNRLGEYYELLLNAFRF